MAIENLYQVCLDGLDSIESTRKNLANKNYHELIFTYTKVRNLLKTIIMKQGNFDNDSLPHKFDDDFDNAFKAQWELFLKHIVCDTPFPWNMLEGAKGVQLAEKGLESWAKKTWVTIPNLT